MSKPTVDVATVAAEHIATRIVLLRGEKVLLDHDLAALYGVETKVLVQAVKRNGVRFPGDFMFQLDGAEWDSLRSQSVTSNAKAAGRGGRRYPPYAFTEQGVAMLSSVLSSPEAVAVNIAIMRAFVKLRKALATNEQLARQFEELVRKVNTHDQALSGLIDSLRTLMQAEREVATSTQTKRPIGFVHHEEKKPMPKSLSVAKAAKATKAKK
jgi:ORF6N domain